MVFLDSEPTRTGPPPKVGLVLGAGGVLGAAWMTGMLPTLQDWLRRPLGAVELIIGTSAGSVLAAALRCHIDIDEMVDYQRGAATGLLSDPRLQVRDGPLPPLPRLRPGSLPLVRATLTRPHRVHPWVAASGWLPQGRSQHVALRAMLDAVCDDLAAAGTWTGTPPEWVDRPTWIVAVDYDTGRRVFFGREGAPRATMPDAVVASCSIPGWYQPTEIGGHRYVDGGVRSTTSLSAMADAGVEEVFVLAPMASLVTDHPRNPVVRLERRVRRLITRTLLIEARSLRAQGIRVTLLTPGPLDLAAIGANLMDPRRREAVLETSLRTSPSAFAGQVQAEPRAA
jgi:NTE family protein